MKTIDYYLFGFSVSEQSNGYTKHLRDHFTTQGQVFLHQAIGGATFNILPYIIDRLQVKQSKVCIFEISTCARFQSSKEGYTSILNYIAAYCKENQTTPVFIQFYRDRVDYCDDLLTQSVSEFCYVNHIPVLNTYQEILELGRAGILRDYLRDGTHTSEMGAALYAQRTIQFLESFKYHQASTNPSHEDISIPEMGLLEKGFFDIHDLTLSKYKSGTFRRGNIELDYITIPQSSSISIEAPPHHLINGGMFLMGPKTGKSIVNLIDHKIKQWRILHDKKSYYRRYAFWFFRNFPTRKMTITTSPQSLSIQLDKGTPWEGERETVFLGVTTQKIRQT